MRKGFENCLLNSACSLTDEESRELIVAYKAGDSEAGGRLIRSQVAWIVKLLRRMPIPRQVEFDDVLSELTLVLLKALRKFDPDRSALTTFVAHIVQRRGPRIVKQLAGQDTVDGDHLQGYCQPDNSAQEAVMDDLVSAISVSAETPYAKEAILMHLKGLKSDAILDHIHAKFPLTKKTNAANILDEIFARMRTYFRKAGYCVPPPRRQDQGVLSFMGG